MSEAVESKERRMTTAKHIQLPDPDTNSPWIRRPTFAAQALDLPMRLNEDGFVMVGSLTCPHRPFIEFLSVASQL